ncbi:hypothetical protein GTA08_BOTSDO03731 [Neofusicoccum parvum]|uniref:Uncharacterized protein n=1 Tax=Neofusicoccum parvum TaxID=310453 RepID=A0ACB5SEB8_9PEZI|nr:hypothetical protein GTA08_BOTSDO03731 [Neofusicoccum parvum]
MPRRKRTADPTIQAPLASAAAPANASPPPAPPRKRARRFKTPPDARVHTSHKPRVRHRNHPDSGVGENFHSVPYPLGLLPHSSWHVLHHRRDPSSTEHHFVCPACRKHRSFPSAYRQKLFLVAERLSWEDGVVPTAERELNQELTWDVNFQLGIEDPVMEDPEQVLGGKNSKTNQWFPFENEVDCAASMRLVARADCLSERSYDVWSKMMDTLYTVLETDAEKEASASLCMPSQPGSGERLGAVGKKAEFYSLLDAIERTSYIGAQYLEAYADHLRDDLCDGCWWAYNTAADDALPG